MGRLPRKFEEEVLDKHGIIFIYGSNMDYNTRIWVSGRSIYCRQEKRDKVYPVYAHEIAGIALEAMTSDGLGHIFRHQNSKGEYFYRFGGQFIYGDIADKILGRWSSVSGILAKEKIEKETQSKDFCTCVFKAVKEIWKE